MNCKGSYKYTLLLPVLECSVYWGFFLKEVLQPSLIIHIYVSKVFRSQISSVSSKTSHNISVIILQLIRVMWGS